MARNKLYSFASVVLIGCGIAVNFIGVRIATLLGLPVYLDSIGTISAAALGGYLPGVIVGFASNCINSLADPITLYYGVVSVIFAVMTAWLSPRGVFRSPVKTLMTIPAFAFVGGVLSSLMTWMLYGLNFGEGISAPFALALYNEFGFTKLLAQVTADFGLDILDKLITLALVYLILRLLPDKTISGIPLGYIYNQREYQHRRLESEERSLRRQSEDKLHFRRVSLSSKVANLIIISAVILSALAITIGTIIYTGASNERYITQCNSVVELMIRNINGDSVQGYLRDGVENEEYKATEARLAAIRESFPDVEYMYVYDVREDACHVVFDIDTEELQGEPLGALVSNEESFQPYFQDLLAGREIEPVVSNEYYGWLLTVYKPIHDSSGKTVAYAAADIAMSDVIADRYTFAIKLVSLLFGASIIIIAAAVWYAQERLARPINAIAETASEFAYDSEEDRKKNVQRMSDLNINTGDEIENLYHAMAKTFADVAAYLNLLDEKSAEISTKAETIAKMQNNIIISFATLVENRDENTGEHIQRTAAYVGIIARRLAKTEKYASVFTPEYLNNLVRSAPLHDIGKIRVPDAVLNKPGRLTTEEYNIMKCHTTAGEEILKETFTDIEGDNYLSEATDMAAYHHEWWNGNGYPRGLSGTAIPLCARIMAVADVFDALVSARVYKPPFSLDDAFGIIREESGTHFDPDIVEAFLSASDEVITVANSAVAD